MSLLKSTLNGMAWTTISTVARSLVSLFQVSILARQLSKEDFGTIAIAVVFIGFTQVFLDLGISSGIMHKQDSTPKQLSSLFWLNVSVGVLLTGVLMALAPLISMFYNDKSLTPIIVLLSLTVLFASWGSQHRTIQQKEMRFKIIAIIEVLSSFLTMGIAVFFAIKGYGVYSLVYSTLAGAFFSNLSFLIIGLNRDKNIRFHFKIKETYPYLKIGIYSIGSSVLDYFAREVDVIFISSAFGRDVLGLYSLCKKVVQMLYGIINPILTRVLTPLFAKMQLDKTHLKDAYLKVIETLSITNFPVYFFVAVFSRGILQILYGEQYVEGDFILSILALYYGLLSVSNPVGSLQIALGRTDIGFYWTIYRVIATLSVVYVGSFFTIEVFVLLILAMAIINTVLMWRFQIYTMIKVDFTNYFLPILKPLSITLFISLPAYFLFHHSMSLYTMLAVFIGLVLVYVTCVNFFLSKSYIVGFINRAYLKRF